MDIERYEKELIDNLVTSIEKHGGKNFLSSIILTGSFGRGESTYTIDANGDVFLKSDVEIALVFRRKSQKNVVDNIIELVSSEFNEDINLMAINEVRVRRGDNFNFTFKKPKYKSIFTYDLFNGSKTIWGRDFIGEYNISLSEVDIYEAKRLVANRIGELVYLQNNANVVDKTYIRKQWKGKLILAIVSAWLICENRYSSSYHGQFQNLKEKSIEAEYIIGQGFVENYEKVFHFLRENDAPYEVSNEKLAGYVRNINEYFKNKTIMNPKINSLGRILKYSIKYTQTGMKFGIRGFENNILQALIDDFGSNSEKIILDAITWHRVLY